MKAPDATGLVPTEGRFALVSQTPPACLPHESTGLSGEHAHGLRSLYLFDPILEGTFERYSRRRSPVLRVATGLI